MLHSYKGMKHPIRVLFVEDDPEMTAVVAENFLPPEFRMVTAADGEQACHLLKDAGRKFDVLLTDNFMPGMDGITLLKKVRKDFPEMKLIMISGYGNWPDYIEAHNIGVSKFLDKPVRMAELKELIRTLAG